MGMFESMTPHRGLDRSVGGGRGHDVPAGGLRRAALEDADTGHTAVE